MANGELIAQIDDMLESGDMPTKMATRLQLQILRGIYTDISELKKAVKDVTDSVKDHHKSFHLAPALKSAKFWTLAFIIFTLFHSAAEELWIAGVSLGKIVIKWLGL